MVRPRSQNELAWWKLGRTHPPRASTSIPEGRWQNAPVAHDPKEAARVRVVFSRRWRPFGDYTESGQVIPVSFRAEKAVTATACFSTIIRRWLAAVSCDKTGLTAAREHHGPVGQEAPHARALRRSLPAPRFAPKSTPWWHAGLWPSAHCNGLKGHSLALQMQCGGSKPGHYTKRKTDYS